MSEPIFSSLLGLYFTVEEYRQHVKPGQTVYIWVPPTFERIEGIAGDGWGAGMTGPISMVKVDSEGYIPVTEENVWCFQPGPIKQRVNHESGNSE